MRVISGIAKAIKLDSLDTIETRPTLDRVKEALFNIIQKNIYDATVLDLFSGSGALGIEAISRGAKKAIFCDSSKNACNIIAKNLEKTRLKEKAIVLNGNYEECLDIINDKFDIVFLDPPYNTDLAVKSISKILEKKILSNDAIIIVETDDEKKIINEIIDMKVQVYDIRKYGKVRLVFIERKEQI